MPADSVAMGQRIRQARLNAGLSQDAVAVHFGIKQQSVGKWETGVTRPSIARVRDLAALFSVTVEYLLGGDSDPLELAAQGSTSLDELRRRDPERWKRLEEMARSELDAIEGDR